MRVFVAYGYNARDAWIPRLVLPLLGAMGIETVTGEDMWGDVITDAVKRRIRQSDALLGFATRRGKDALPDGTFPTHRWVTDEMAFASALDLPVVEVRESDVSDQGGILGDRQRIRYDEATRDECLVDIARAMGRLNRGLRLQLQLLPVAIVESLRTLIDRPGFRCSYRLMVDGFEEPEREASIVPIQGGLFLRAEPLPQDALIRVRVQANGHAWSSDYEPLDTRGVTLRDE
jgi:hypothetical protein